MCPASGRAAVPPRTPSRVASQYPHPRQVYPSHLVMASSISELAPRTLSLLARSLVLHTGAEPSMRATLLTAVEALPIPFDRIVRLLDVVAESAEHAPPFDVALHAASTLLLTPAHQPLRVLGVVEAAQAWVVADLLCLGSATRRLEDDLVQRFVENPAAVLDWRAAIVMAECPATDTLWAIATSRYAALRRQWAGDAPVPPEFGGAIPPLLAGKRGDWVHKQCVTLLDDTAAEKPGAVSSGFLVPLLLATIRHHADAHIVGKALRAVGSLAYHSRVLVGCSTALHRFGKDRYASRACKTVTDAAHAVEEDQRTMAASGIAPLLVTVLADHTSDASVVALACTALSTVVQLIGVKPVLLSCGVIKLLTNALAAHFDTPSPSTAILRTLLAVLLVDPAGHFLTYPFFHGYK